MIVLIDSPSSHPDKHQRTVMGSRDPQDPSSFHHRKATLSTGQIYHFVDEFEGISFDAERTPTLLCFHGFPDLWYGWRYQIGPWVDKGWRVVVPDMLGYGESEKPNDINFYTTKSLATDMAALLDFINVDRAIIVGHDWGSEVAWRFAMWHPDRCRALINLSIPYVPPSTNYRSLEEVATRMPDFGYQLYLADLASTQEIEQNLERFFAAMYQTRTSPYPRYSVTKRGELAARLLQKGEKRVLAPIWNDELNSKEMAYILDKYRKGGMTGPLNYYRTTRLRYEQEKGGKLSSSLPKNIPWLFIYGTKDPTCSKKYVAKTKQYVPQLQEVRLEGKGHWVMVEAREAVTQCVIDFVQRHVEAIGRAKL